jgi:hypothetical protein
MFGGWPEGFGVAVDVAGAAVGGSVRHPRHADAATAIASIPTTRQARVDRDMVTAPG